MTGNELVEGVKEAIVRAKEEGTTDRKVAALFGIGKYVVHQVHQRCHETKTVANLPKSGRPRKSTERNDRAQVKIVKDDSKKTAPDVTKYANECLKLGITSRTARNIPKRANLPAAKLSNKPWIPKKNVKARLKFARAHLDWSIADWERVQVKYFFFQWDSICETSSWPKKQSKVPSYSREAWWRISYNLG